MRILNKIMGLCVFAASVSSVLTSCEESGLYSVNSPDWLSERIDSINNSKNTGEEEVLVGMKEDVYTIGKTDFSTGWWTSFSKYYVVPENTKWNAVFNLSLDPGTTIYYKNFALIVTNDFDRGATDYKEYGAIRFDYTNDSTAYNSQWGNFYFKYSKSTLALSPVDNADENMQKLGGKITLTVDRSKPDTFLVKMTNGTVTKTFTQPYKLANYNTDASDNNIRCFLVPEGSYINFLQTNVEPIGGLTSANDKQPLSMELAGVPEEITAGEYTGIDEAMANVSAVVTFEEGVTKTVTAKDLTFSAIPDLNTLGTKTLVAVYNQTFKGEGAAKPVIANAKFNVVNPIASIAVTKSPTYTTYSFYNNEAISGVDHPLSFSDAGMQVEATYKDGSKTVMDNSKLTFTTVPRKAGEHTVTITTSNGKTATVKVNVNEIKSVKTLHNSASSLGAADNSTGWWSVFTDDFAVASNTTASLSFTNYAGANNYNNYVVILRNKAAAEYAVVRADDYGWGNGYNTAVHGKTAGEWAPWLAAMNGAKVTLYVTNCGNGTADVISVAKGNDGNTYYQYYLGISTIDPSDFNMALTVDGSHLVF